MLERCGTLVGLQSAQVVDRSSTGNVTDAIVEVKLRAMTDIPGDAMGAGQCTGTNWNNTIPPGRTIVLTKIVSFQMFSTQAVCLTKSMSPIMKGSF
jgi:hypothetical protein